MADNIDYLSGEDEDLLIENGDFVNGDSTGQEVRRVLLMNQGMLMSDPLLGPDLVRLMNQKAKPEEFKRSARLHLERDGKDFKRIEKQLKLLTNGS